MPRLNIFWGSSKGQVFPWASTDAVITVRYIATPGNFFFGRCSSATLEACEALRYIGKAVEKDV